MTYAYVVQPCQYIQTSSISEVFLGKSEDSSDVQDFCRKIDASWESIGHHIYSMSKGQRQYIITKMRLT